MSIQCPCGGGLAYSRDEMIEWDAERMHPLKCQTGSSAVDAAAAWSSIMAPDDFYCPHEDTVLLPDQIDGSVHTA